MNSSPLRFLLSFPVIAALILGSVIAWTWIDGHVARSAALILLPALWVVLTAVWWVLRGKGRRLKRLGVVVLVGVVMAAVLAFTVRREGSADGTAFPKFTWRWTKPDVVELPAIAETPAPKADVGAPPAGVADFTRFMGVNGDGVIPMQASRRMEDACST